MTRKPEQKLWDTMKANKPRETFMERIENGVGSGMPDVYLRKPDWQTWIELKQCNVPARISTRMLGAKGLSQDQINWHMQHASLGLYSYVLVRDDQGGLYLLRGELADRINDMSWGDLHANSCAWTWPAIFAEIAP